MDSISIQLPKPQPKKGAHYHQGLQSLAYLNLQPRMYQQIQPHEGTQTHFVQSSFLLLTAQKTLGKLYLLGIKITSLYYQVYKKHPNN